MLGLLPENETFTSDVTIDQLWGKDKKKKRRSNSSSSRRPCLAGQPLDDTAVRLWDTGLATHQGSLSSWEFVHLFLSHSPPRSEQECLLASQSSSSHPAGATAAWSDRPSALAGNWKGAVNRALQGHLGKVAADGGKPGSPGAGSPARQLPCAEAGPRQGPRGVSVGPRGKDRTAGRDARCRTPCQHEQSPGAWQVALEPVGTRGRLLVSEIRRS